MNDDRTKALFGSVSQGTVAEWFDLLQTNTTWGASKTHWLKDNIYTIIYEFFLTHMDRHEWTRLLSRLLTTTVAIRQRIFLQVHLILVFLNHFHTPLSFQPDSPVVTIHPTTPSSLPSASSYNPTNFQ